MGDFYTEQLVKRQKASSTTLIKAILIILTVLSVVRYNRSGDHDRTGCFFVPEYGC
mgnify:CR=1 FL=1